MNSNYFYKEIIAEMNKKRRKSFISSKLGGNFSNNYLQSKPYRLEIPTSDDLTLLLTEEGILTIIFSSIPYSIDTSLPLTTEELFAILVRTNNIVYELEKDPESLVLWHGKVRAINRDLPVKIEIFGESYNFENETPGAYGSVQLLLKIPATYYLTTTPYPYKYMDSFGLLGSNLFTGRLSDNLYGKYSNNTNEMTLGFKEISGIFRILVQKYLYYNEDEMFIEFKSITGIFRDVLNKYSFQKETELMSIYFKSISGLLRSLLIKYIYKITDENITIDLNNISASSVKLEDSFETFIINRERTQDEDLNLLVDNIPERIWTLVGKDQYNSIVSTQYYSADFSLDLDGTNYIYTPENNNDLKVLDNELIISMYVRPNLHLLTHSNNKFILFKKGTIENSSYEAGFILNIDNSINFYARMNNTILYSNDIKELSITWHKYSVSFYFDSIHITIDNNIKFSKVLTSVITNNDNNLYIGTDNINTSNNFNGFIDNINIQSITKEETDGNNSEEDPEVIINTFTTSALDFENELTDKIESTIWQTTGTSEIIDDNVIFNKKSFNFKTLEDSLYTNSNILTGGSTPFTIEFYALIDHLNLTLNTTNDYPLFSKFIEGSPNLTTGLFLVNPNKTTIDTNVHQSLRWVFSNNNYYLNSDKINFYEINKFKITYDGSALRFFINDVLSGVFGTLNPFAHSGSFRLMSRTTPNFSTTGLLDNVNIFDGECRQVRDYDAFEDNLIVDLAFDGENNSTQITDNGSLKSIWTANGNAKISIDQKFEGFSSLLTNSPNSYLLTTSTINLRTEDFVINLDVIFTSVITSGWDILFSNMNPISTPNSIPYVQFGYTSNSLYFKYSTNIETYLDITTSFTPEVNRIYNLKIIRKDKIIYLLIDNIIKSYIKIARETKDIILSDNGGFCIGTAYWAASNTYHRGYIKNFKVSKGISVFPKNTEGNIQLNFDNNLNDKYNNSTWTNNGGVVFDQANSAKGFATRFNGVSQYLSSSSVSNLNFNSNNFLIEADMKSTAVGGNLGALLIRPDRNFSFNFGGSGNSNSNFSFYGTSPEIKEEYSINSLNQYYNLKALRQNNVINLIKNDVIVFQTNLTSTHTFNFSNTNGSRLGGDGTSNFRFNGYIDNFKTIKEDLTNQTINLLPPSGTTATLSIIDESLNVAFSGTSGTNRYCTNILHDSPALKNFTAEVELLIKPGTTNYGGLGFRTIDFTNAGGGSWGYQAYLTGNNIRFGRGSNNSSNIWTQLATMSLSDYADNNFHILKIEAFNTNFKIYLDNDLIFNITDSTWDYSSNFAIPNYFFQNGISSRTRRVDIWNENNEHVYHLDWKSKLDLVINKPVVHLPLETNSINLGINPLTITATGSPNYSSYNNRKCLVLDVGKYYTIANNNIFNIRSSTDFYIEFDFCPILDKYHHVFCNGSTTTSNLVSIAFSDSSYGRIVYLSVAGTTRISSSTSFILNSFNKVKLYRKGSLLTLELNGVKNSIQFLTDLNFSFTSTRLGAPAFTTNSDSVGYLSDFKMFIGAYETPKDYNFKKILNLDFKPTGKSYLFKDNNNKCIIHPVNINYRDYQNSKYCCTFDGTSQYLQLGKNDALNFGNDDFLLEVKFEIDDFSKIYPTIIGSSNTSFNNINCCFLMIYGDSVASNISFGKRRLVLGVYGSTATGNPICYSNFDLIANKEYTFIIQRKNNVFKLYSNKEDVTEYVVSENSYTNIFNLNGNNNTFIGRNGWDGLNSYFNGTIYGIKILRNTNDISLLDDGNEVIENPLDLVFKEFSNSYDPLNIELNFDKVLVDSVEDLSILNFDTSFEDLQKEVSVERIDIFNNTWYIPTGRVLYERQINARNKEIYFNGNSCIYSYNRHYSPSFTNFNLSFNFKIDRFRNLNTVLVDILNNIQVRISNINTLQILINGSITTIPFTLSPNSNYYFMMYKDSDDVLRVFINNNLVYSTVSAVQILNTSNSVIVLGNSWGNLNTSIDCFEGFLYNFNYKRSKPLTEDPYVSQEIIPTTKYNSLLNFEIGGISEQNNNISWMTNNTVITNINTKYRPYNIRLNTVNSYLRSNIHSDINTNGDFTIDLIFTPFQTTAEAVLLDLRKGGMDSTRGIYVSQPSNSTASIQVQIGAIAGSWNISYNSGVNTILNNTTYHLRIVRNMEYVHIFLQGVLVYTTTLVEIIEIENQITLGNRVLLDRGFNGWIEQFRLIDTASSINTFTMLRELK